MLTYVQWTLVAIWCVMLTNSQAKPAENRCTKYHYLSLIPYPSFPTFFTISFLLSPIPYSFSSGWKRRIRRAAQVGRHSSFPAQMPAGELPYKRLSISKGSFLRHLAWRIWMTGKELLKLVHEKSSASNREMVLFHRKNQSGKHRNKLRSSTSSVSIQ